MTDEDLNAARWWEAIEPGTPAELGFVCIDREGSTSDWESLPREDVIVRRGEFLKLVEAIAEGFEAVMPLAWQGDGAMIFVRDARTAALLAITLHERLVTAGFRVRIAAHAGRVAFHPETGKMADPEIDRAGHLEHDSPVGGAALSEDVYLALPQTLRDRCSYLGTTLRDRTIAHVFPAAAKSRRDSSRFVAANDDLQAVEQRFLRYLDSPDVRRLRFVGFRLRRPDPPSLEILDVFTPLDVDESVSARPEVDLALAIAGAPEDALFGAPWARSSRPPAIGRPFRELLAAHRQLIVLGDPGSGKSTLLRWLAVTAGLGRLAMRQGLGLDERLVPLLLPIGRLWELRQALAQETPSREVSVPDAIVRYFRGRHVGEDPEALRRLLLHRLEQGACLLLLDGLDETPGETRHEVVRWIEGFAAVYRENRFIVTSRLFGYPGLTLPGGSTITLRSFTDEQIGIYLQSWHRAYRAWESNLSREGTELDRPAADAQAKQLFRVIQGDRRLGALARNPFLLSAIALVHRAEGQLPAHRVQLYEVFARSLCETWDAARRLTASDHGAVRRIDYETEAIPVLGRVALWLHERHPSGAAPEVDVREEIVAALIDEYGIARPEAEQSAREFLRRASEDLQILVPKGPDQFGFMHLTFQEFFAAAFLHARERFDQEARARWYDARWEEIILLGVGMLAIIQKRPAAASAFVQGILGWTVDQYPWLTQVLEKHVCLAARCAAAASNLDAAVYEAVGEALIRLTTHDRYDAKRGAGRSVLRSTQDTRLGTWLLVRLEGQLRNNPMPEVRARSAEALGALADRRATDLLVDVLLHDATPDVSARAAEALGALQDDRALDPLVEMLSSGAEPVRNAAAIALGALNSGKTREPLIVELLQREDPSVRRAAASALRSIRAASSVPALIGTLTTDTDPTVREAAAHALGSIGDDRAVQPLVAALQSDPDVRTVVVLSLGALPSAAALAPLLQLIEEDNLVPSFLVPLGLSSFHTPEVQDHLLRILRENSNPLTRAMAAVGLMPFLDAEVTTALIDVLKEDSDAIPRSAAASVLGYRDQPESLEALRQAITSDDESVRTRAIFALARAGDPRVIEPLLNRLAIDTVESAEETISALWRLSNRLPAAV